MARTEIQTRQHRHQPVSSQPTFSHTHQAVAGHGTIQIKYQGPAKGPRKGFTDLILLGKPWGDATVSRQMERRDREHSGR